MLSKVHQGMPVTHRGDSLAGARVAVIMIHGRGGGVDSILPLTVHLMAQGVAFLAPAAENDTWYPQRFLAPRAENEPHLSSALKAVDDVVASVRAHGIPQERIVLLGFSQGACLALEYAARNPARYGAIIALSGSLIGADDEMVGYVGSLKGTPVLIGCSDVDGHIPVERVYITAEILQGLGAEVDVRIYPGMGHTINQEEADIARSLIAGLLA